MGRSERGGGVETMNSEKEFKNAVKKEKKDFVIWFIWQDNTIKLTNSEWIKKYEEEGLKR